MGRIVKKAAGDNNKRFENIVNGNPIQSVHTHSRSKIGECRNETTPKSPRRQRHM